MHRPSGGQMRLTVEGSCPASMFKPLRKDFHPDLQNWNFRGMKAMVPETGEKAAKVLIDCKNRQLAGLSMKSAGMAAWPASTCRALAPQSRVLDEKTVPCACLLEVPSGVSKRDSKCVSDPWLSFVPEPVFVVPKIEPKRIGHAIAPNSSCLLKVNAEQISRPLKSGPHATV